MKSFLLLILSLMTGCEAWLRECQEGWIEFTCKYPNPIETYQRIEVKLPNDRKTQSTQVDVWETKDRVSLYHDTKSKQLRVAIKQCECMDSGEYECKFDQESQSSEEQEVKVTTERDGCQGKFTQTAYRAAKTTITCDYPGDKDKSNVKFFCKENDVICEDILSTKSPPKSNGTFSLTETNSGFTVSISNVSSHDAGVYWCGVDKGKYRAGIRKIQLKVEDITTLRTFQTIGQNFTYWCVYPNGTPIKKFICKGEDPSVCTPLVSTSWTNKTNGKFFLRENKERTNLTITVREVTADDAGTYWCGAENTDKTHSNPFFHRLVMTVVPSPTLTTSIISPILQSVSTPFVSSTKSTSSSSDRTGGFWLTLIIAVVVCGAVLVLLFILFLVYKQSENSKSHRNGGEQNNKDDGAYEEIQELPQKSHSGTALKTIYVTANFPTNPSPASHHYSTINFQNSSVKGSSDTYCSVRDNDKPPTYSTVNHPSGVAEDPFYSTVNKPQQH